MKEAASLTILNSPKSSTHEKAMACDNLGRVGTAKAVPALAELLPDPKLNDYARDALERIADPAAGKALVDALATLKDNLRLGVMITLGDRREKSATAALADIAKGGDSGEVAVALNSLSKIADEAAAKSILAALGSGKSAIRTSAAHAALAAADYMGKAGKKDHAAKLRKAIAAAKVPDNIKKAAVR